MKGFILKDIYLIKGNIKTLLILFIAFAIMTFNNIDFLTVFLPFLCIMICISTFGYDEFNHWDAYALTLPNGRKNVVKSKYVSTIIMIIISMLISAIISSIVGIIGDKLDIENLVGNILGSGCAILFIISLMYPLIYKFGAEKGRIFLFVVCFMLSAIVGLAAVGIGKLGLDLTIFIQFFVKYLIYILPVLAILMIVISYFISYRIYQRKEF